jgi:hypothetical protein
MKASKLFSSLERDREYLRDRDREREVCCNESLLHERLKVILRERE